MIKLFTYNRRYYIEGSMGAFAGQYTKQIIDSKVIILNIYEMDWTRSPNRIHYMDNATAQAVLEKLERDYGYSDLSIEER